MNKRCHVFLILTLFLVIGLTIHCIPQVKIGDILTSWTEGYLDIHHINTGKGESTFFILPDGTTMLVDAGATQRQKPRVTDPKPNDSRTPGEWVTRYISHFMETLPEKKLDYALLTHFHDDHIGELSPGAQRSKNGNYKLTGIIEVAEYISIGKLVDRSCPEYNWPTYPEEDYVQNYIQFVKFNQKNKNFEVGEFLVGSNNQFLLVNSPDKYPGFEIRNIAANGHVWTGVGNNERNHFPPMGSLNPSEYPSENKLSCAFRLSYGKFDYFNGGDLTIGEPGTWQDIETPVGMVTGPVDVCIANHHAYYDAMGVQFLQVVRPRVHIIQVWSPSHPSPSVLSRMMSTWIYPGERDVFTTNIMPETKTVIGSRMDKLKSSQGHIVIRVNPGGDSYMIYILDDSEEDFKIKTIHGPYTCN